jgi:tetratricopeptide (TPR) repeat protein
MIISKVPDNLVLKRLMAYNSFETGDFSNGLLQIQEFFRIANPFDILPSDYKYYARLLAKNNQDSLSIVNYLKVVALSDTSNELYKEIASTYEKMKKYDESARYMEKFIKSTENPENSDLFYWGKDCYLAAGDVDTTRIASDPERKEVRKVLLAKADSIFSIVISHVPDNYLGYLWRARVDAMSDPETEQGLAKPCYEKVADILEQTKVHKNELLESYQYLGYYYYLKKDNQNSLIFWNKILTIDPVNTVALKAVKGIK